MRRAPSMLLKALVLVYGLIVSSGVTAAGNGAAGNASKRPNNSFSLFVPAGPNASAVVLPTQGVGIASNRGVIMDPYKVPLIQGAGSLTTGR